MGKTFLDHSHTNLKEIEKALDFFLIERSAGSLSQAEESELGKLLKRKHHFLLLEEARWWLKSRAIWMKGDSNTKIFHKFA
jgi:hypothetical protein